MEISKEKGGYMRRLIPPKQILIGEFTLDVLSYDDLEDTSLVRIPKEISGVALLRLGCIREGVQISKMRYSQYPRIINEAVNMREVVWEVTHPQTQISFKEAKKYKSDVAIGQILKVPFRDSNIGDSTFSDDLGIPLFPREKGGILVHFEVKEIEKAIRIKEAVRILVGVVYCLPHPMEDEPIQIQIEGFTIYVEELTLTPSVGKATIKLKLPDCFADRATCGPAILALGEVDFSPNCEFSADRPEGNVGPWIMVSNGLVISGKGFVAQFSSPSNPSPLVYSWKGLVLKEGEASGRDLAPYESNTGYLIGLYTFSDAIVTSQGFDGNLNLSLPISFDTSNPRGYSIYVDKAQIQISQCRIKQGYIKDGEIALPSLAVCDHPSLGRTSAKFSILNIDENLDLFGEVNFNETQIGWGELTHPSQECIAWGITLSSFAYFYLPGGPCRSYCPDTGGGFTGISIYSILAELKAKGIGGITSTDLSKAQIYSMDRRGDRGNPISFPWVRGWIHIGSFGIDGEIIAVEGLESKGDYTLGNPSRSGYLAEVPFNSVLNLNERAEVGHFRFITSAICDSDLRGSLSLPQPCGFSLDFFNMMATSTADLIGGDIELPTNGRTYDYWKLDLVPMGNPSKAGILSIRTGQIIMTAAGLQEKVHFDKPFRVTWEEIYSDGNIGEIFFDFNSSGQMFDKISFSTHRLLLSKYSPNVTDGYLAVAGTVHFNFFGSAYINIHDARNDYQSDAPFNNRKVTVPNVGESGWDPTDLTLHSEWNVRRATFDFPNDGMKYHETAQNGFIGDGTGSISFINSPQLDTKVEIHAEVIDIRISSKATSDVDFGFYSRMGGIAELYGCARIIGPLLQRITIHGLLEHSVTGGTGIIEPKAGEIVETFMSITPTSCTYAFSGDVMVTIGGTEIDISGSALFSVDFAQKTAEGQFQGKINCTAARVAVEGEGQVTWHIDPNMLSFQGNLKVAINSWSGGIGMEGGLFLGYNVPKDQAWVLQIDSNYYQLKDYLLPKTLTGAYGYGRIAFDADFCIFGGGIEIFAGMGAFLDSPPGLTPDFDTTGFPLPYVLGRGGLFLHGEILGGLVSAEGWATLQLYGPLPLYFEGSLGLRGCVFWHLCASVSVTAGISSNGTFYLE